ncbi:glycosyltransferase 61 family protein [Methylobacterium nonmethylotrophicum]|nr:glycosyltransferase family 61 protein [Methylobacterium nonmethylotrophicum]
MPTQYLKNSAGLFRQARNAGIFRGGPVFPGFAWQLAARHCRGRLPVPSDRRPRPAAVRREAAAGIWCGPVCHHYGHMIADFGMRIAQASRSDPGLPLVFSSAPDAACEPPAFFWQILAHFGVGPERVLLVREPTRFRLLHVPRQAERLDGPGPGRAHLDLMDAIVAGHAAPARDIELLFVSRARWPDGRLAGEPYLANILERAGATVLHPELHDVADQVRFMRRAKRIVFSEGSAVHTLQLLGRLDATVAVIERRPGNRLAEGALRPRVRALEYWSPSRGVLYGLTARGWPRRDRSFGVFDEGDLLARLERFGLDIRGQWCSGDYARRLSDDVALWVAMNGYAAHHPGTLPFIRRQIGRLGLAVDIEGAWRIGTARFQ